MKSISDKEAEALSKPFALYLPNKTYCSTQNPDDFDKLVVLTWANNNNVKNDSVNFSISGLINKGYLLRKGFTSKDFIKRYKENITKWKTSYILFNNLSDIHPDVERALRFIINLYEYSKHLKVYILSYNMKEDVSKYAYIDGIFQPSIMEIHGLEKIRKKRVQQDDEYLDRLDFALYLRKLGYKYKDISPHVHISEGTLRRRYREKYPNAPQNEQGEMPCPTQEEIKELHYEYFNRMR